MDQITKLENQNTFDYMIIKASGITEPNEVAKISQKYTGDHDCKEEHQRDENEIMLSNIARLDTYI